jgi:alkanesulfonate monooxygenase SsuD/methylene tetrahydromethanopterin reductase-like flavin-dependent oxidoreductase (luciferase family)
MKFGVGYSSRDWRGCPDVAMRAEELGFNSFFIPDHYMWPTTNDTVDAWTLLTHLAAKTSIIRLGTIVTPIPFRHPAILAKTIATIDILSNGRVNFGVGAGWFKPEFEAYSIWDEKYVRVAKFTEGLRLILKLWNEACVTFSGRFYQCKGAVLEPKPVQKPHPPIWFGTSGDHMLRLAVKYGNGWVSNFGRSVLPSPEQVQNIICKLHENEKTFGQTRPFTIAVGGCLEDGIKRVEQMIELGCDYYVLSVDQTPPGPVESVTRFAKEILPSFI